MKEKSANYKISQISSSYYAQDGHIYVFKSIKIYDSAMNMPLLLSAFGFQLKKYSPPGHDVDYLSLAVLQRPLGFEIRHSYLTFPQPKQSRDCS